MTRRQKQIALAFRRAALVRQELDAEHSGADRVVEREKERVRVERRKELDAREESGDLRCDWLPWIEPGSVSYEEFIVRVVRKIRRRGQVELTGVREPEKLRLALRREAKKQGMPVRTIDVIADARRAGWLHPSLAERMINERGWTIVAGNPDFEYPREWHSICGDDGSDEFGLASTTQRVRLVRAWIKNSGAAETQGESAATPLA